MENIYKAEKTTICADKKCVTVYGKAARTVNGIALGAAVFLAVALIVKTLR